MLFGTAVAKPAGARLEEEGAVPCVSLRAVVAPRGVATGVWGWGVVPRLGGGEVVSIE